MAQLRAANSELLRQQMQGCKQPLSSAPQN
jgi:hypothetical protein